MFTGLVGSKGRLLATRRQGAGLRLEVGHALPGGPLERGESIATDGVCLTVTEPGPDRFAAELSPETLARTGGCARWRAGREVNLERALAAGDRLGGHVVQGHADGVLRLTGWRRLPGGWVEARVAYPPAARAWIVEKGSIALDGVSLTIAKVGGSWFECALVPATLVATTLGDRRPGDELVVEYDVLAKVAAQAVTRAGGRA
ncbi:MAG: riboflavin synthase [Acidobacteria bacterium]|nr:riboflavin synthase [Acidobacteriota bacterium]